MGDLDARYRRFEPDWSLRATNLIYANWLPNFDLPRHKRPYRFRSKILFDSDARQMRLQGGLGPEEIEAAFNKTILCHLLLPAVTLADREFARDAQRQGFLVTTLALQLYHRRHGRFPDTLDELRDVGLQEIPDDPFGDGKPLNYRLSVAGAIVSSGPVESAITGRSFDQAIEVPAPDRR